jgi:hypothetical protein
MLSKKDAKDRVQQIKSTMAHLLGVPVLVSLGPHEFSLQIANLDLATVASLAIAPEKVYNPETGKQTTPQVMQMLFSTGEVINVVLDDIDDFSVGISGAAFKIGKEELKVSYDRQNASAAP